MKTLRLFIWSIFAATQLTAFGQGSLTPPSAPAPTMKTLAQIEPRIPISSTPTNIFASGSYYLTTNLNASGDAIFILANDVVLDLSGFTIRGSGSDRGITLSPAIRNVRIQNGTIREFGEGIIGASTPMVTVENVQLISNSISGINIGADGRIVDCVASGSGSWGIKGQDRAQVTGCKANSNFSGITMGSGSLVRDCSTCSNSAAGISLGDNSQAEGCFAQANGSSGFNFGNGGICARNTATQNSFYGFFFAEQCLIQSCSARGNFGVGFSVGHGGQITDCTSSMNTSHGIQLADNAVARNNNCFKNSATGIAFNAYNRLEGNHANENGSGLQASSIYNVVTRNSAVGNAFTNIALSSANTFGPATFLGPTLTNDNPHANYTP